MSADFSERPARYNSSDQRNQFVAYDKDFGLFLVVRGVSNGSEGDKLADVITSSIFSFVKRNISIVNKSSLLRDSFVFSQKKMMAYCSGKMSSQKLGVSIAALLVFSGIAYVSFLGDIGCYLVRKKDVSVLHQKIQKKRVLVNDFFGSGSKCLPVVVMVQLEHNDLILLGSNRLLEVFIDEEMQASVSNQTKNQREGVSYFSLSSDNEINTEGEVKEFVLSVVVDNSFFPKKSSSFSAWEGSDIFLG